MFLLRRKSDGKYFRNKGYHADSYWRRRDGVEDPRWRDNPNECVPFSTELGAKSCRAVGSYCPVPWPSRDTPREEVLRLQNERGRWYSKKNAKVRRAYQKAEFDKRFEVVSVTMELRSAHDERDATGVEKL
jgi:hypothetical protein